MRRKLPRPTLLSFPTLDRLWSKGSTVIGDLTFESAAYTARYCMKKITGDQAESHYEHVDKQTGECTQLKPEYTTMSRRPGIGKPWLDKFLSDVYPSDEVISRGYPAQPPTFYDSQYELEHPEFMKQIKRLESKSKSVSKPTTHPSAWPTVKPSPNPNTLFTTGEF